MADRNIRSPWSLAIGVVRQVIGDFKPLTAAQILACAAAMHDGFKPSPGRSLSDVERELLRILKDQERVELEARAERDGAREVADD